MTGQVYLVKMGTYYKIGSSTNFKRRLSQLKRNSPFKLEVVLAVQVNDCREAEKELLTKFTAKHIKGEWFRLEDGDSLIIKEYLESLQITKSHQPLMSHKCVPIRNFQRNMYSYEKEWKKAPLIITNRSQAQYVMADISTPIARQDSMNSLLQIGRDLYGEQFIHGLKINSRKGVDDEKEKHNHGS